ncbi:TetR/AcrR family transcriptional regulator [Microbulbifer agarilyticus]|uniref:TetR/AcrR family transcriptional regulator n=1 Tax=Microbulbifer agarilyticus TaxID=260552 RepID=UPI001CD339E2|nr:TetR/AcrR family transcriptional regulator [Microbulbifer agarilyticus]MCA0900539.1 TetR/AcrR family transcriptional regulator [Microbulbifer agarilyticus]
MSEVKARKSEGEVSWQSKKSAMTRDRILEAAIDCFINLGYANVTTAKVADAAGVSRGAMLHHFPSKTELIQAAVEYLHSKLLDDYTQRVARIPKKLKGKERRRAGLDAYWEHLTGDLFVVYHELCVAGRTDEELNSILERATARFEEHVHESNHELFEEWNERGDLYFLAMDLTKFMMEGMAVGQWGKNKNKRINRLLDYLGDRLEEIFSDDGPTAISQHSSKMKAKN